MTCKEHALPTPDASTIATISPSATARSKSRSTVSEVAPTV